MKKRRNLSLGRNNRSKTMMNSKSRLNTDEDEDNIYKGTQPTIKMYMDDNMDI